MKKLKYLAIIFLFMFLCTGCVKYNANMTIKKDKQMDFSIIYALNKNMLGDESVLDKKEVERLKKDGYLVKDYEKDDMKGFTITKKYKNIDNISNDKDVEYSLSGILEKGKKQSNVFRVKKGLFKNHYYADFKFDSKDSSLNTDLSDDNLDTDFGYEETETSESDEESSFDTSAFESLMSGSSSMDLSFNVTLPYKAIKNNASSTKNEDKELKWDLSTDNNKDIKFEFELYNYKNIYLTIGISSVILISIITLLIALLTKKKKGAK